ncbi:hypothetical protein FACS1894151_11470 [Spirochaetia bacterium]|nr:hypothetical protein FACS1894151_11470 [Spirochaetia bacterium]
MQTVQAQAQAQAAAEQAARDLAARVQQQRIKDFWSGNTWGQQPVYIGARAGAYWPTGFLNEEIFGPLGGTGSLLNDEYPGVYLGKQGEFYEGLFSGYEIAAFAAIRMGAFSLQFEGVYTTDDTVGVIDDYYDDPLMTFHFSSIQIPALLRFNIRMGIILLTGYGGGYITIPLEPLKMVTVNGTSSDYNVKDAFPIGYIFGGMLGLRLGPFVFFADARYLADIPGFGMVVVNNSGIGNWTEYELYHRERVSVTFGVEFGFGNFGN